MKEMFRNNLTTKQLQRDIDTHLSVSFNILGLCKNINVFTVDGCVEMFNEEN